MGLRSYSTGNDTYRYYLKFLQNQNMSWGEVISQGPNFGFQIFTKLISVLTNNYSIYLMIIAGFIMLSIYYFLKEHSEDVLMSQIMLLSLGFIFFYMTGAKQTIAMGILLFAYTVLCKKKYILFAILVIVAASFHTTAIVFAVAWPLSMLKLKKSYFFVAPVLVAIAYAFRAPIFNFMRMLVIEQERYVLYGTTIVAQLSLTGLYIQLIIFALSLFCLRNKFEEDTQLSGLFALYTVGMMFQAMTGIMAEFFRLSMYYSIAGVILLPKAMNRGFTESSTQIAKILVISVFILYFVFFSSKNEYIIPFYFFFNQ